MDQLKSAAKKKAQEFKGKYGELAPEVVNEILGEMAVDFQIMFWEAVREELLY